MCRHNKDVLRTHTSFYAGFLKFENNKAIHFVIHILLNLRYRRKTDEYIPIHFISPVPYVYVQSQDKQISNVIMRMKNKFGGTILSDSHRNYKDVAIDE